ncbi:TRAP-type C4-dicarboxylate transport system substrate-binding protein [Sulfitobacter undariae]|uniref:TRAP-type C4-dicarboxylate transport system substrate-binding protein n=1 Tax=Sulfitobacter undariae TaxID=1563671 RepID=A0A7W6E6L7_9RHOB|nr:C4-dicarboxylate TRAP transporter substrate-binding protein [Sulfitobacter undariae]MBB3995169.1 TRAP-type C4-dicarboxylate transport system substrate-binding protein [Sulfitobacter undariae]
MTALSKLTLAAILTASSIAGAASAKEKLNFAYGYPENSNIGLAVTSYAAAVEERSGGEVTVTGFPMSLLSLSETSAGVRDGLADVGYVLTAYFAAEYPTNLYLHELNQLLNLIDNPTGKEPLAFAGAMLEYTVKDCPECQQEFKAQNQVYTAGGVTPVYNLLCKDAKITSIEDLKGKRLRAGGAGFVRFAEHFGAQAVRLPVNEVYEALDQGIIDCAMLNAPEITNYSLEEVLTDITMRIPGGVYAGTGGGNINLDRWNNMDDKAREALLWGGSRITADATWNFYTNDAVAIQNTRDAGIEIHQPDAALIAAAQEFSRQDLQAVAALFRDTYNVPRAEEIAQEFPALLEKWNGLVADIDSADALHQLYWDEVMSKVDPATYGK